MDKKVNFNEFIEGYRNIVKRIKSREVNSKNADELLAEMNVEAERLRNNLNRSENADERRIALEKINEMNFSKRTEEIVKNRDNINHKAKDAKKEIKRLENARNTILDNAEKFYLSEKNRIEKTMQTMIDLLNAKGTVPDPSIKGAINQSKEDLIKLEQQWRNFKREVIEIDNVKKIKEEIITSDEKSSKVTTDDKKASKTTTADKKTPKDAVIDNKWGPLSDEEIDDAIQKGFYEYTPGDDDQFDEFLLEHNYNPKKLKEEKEAAEKDKDKKDSKVINKWGPLSDEEIDDAIQKGFYEYTPGDDDQFDEFLVEHNYDPKKLKEEKEAAEATAKTGAEKFKGAEKEKIKYPDWFVDMKNHKSEPVDVPAPKHGGKAYSYDAHNWVDTMDLRDDETYVHSPEKAAAGKKVYSIVYDGFESTDKNRYNLRDIEDKKLKNSLPITRFKEAEIKSARKRAQIMMKDKSIKKLLEAHPEISKKILKKADPTILRGFSNFNEDYAIAYLNKLSTGKFNKSEKLDIDDILIRYDVKVDDSNFDFMRRMAKSHKNIAEVSIPTFWERLKYKFSRNKEALPEAEEPKKLDKAKNEEEAKVPDVTSSKDKKKSWDLSTEEKKDAEESYKRKFNRTKEKHEYIFSRKRMSSEEYIADLKKMGRADKVKEYEALLKDIKDGKVPDSAAIEFRDKELNERFAESAKRRSTEDGKGRE